MIQRACDCVDVNWTVRNCFYHLCNFKFSLYWIIKLSRPVVWISIEECTSVAGAELWLIPEFGVAGPRTLSNGFIRPNRFVNCEESRNRNLKLLYRYAWLAEPSRCISNWCRLIRMILRRSSMRYILLPPMTVCWYVTWRREICEIVRYLPDQKKTISASSQTVATARIAPKVCHGQPLTFGSQRSKFHPNRFTFGGVTAGRVKAFFGPSG